MSALSFGRFSGLEAHISFGIYENPYILTILSRLGGCEWISVFLQLEEMASMMPEISMFSPRN